MTDEQDYQMSDDDIKQYYITCSDRGESEKSLSDEFDQWLRQVKKCAWDEGYDAGGSWNDGLGTYVSKTENPYAVSPEGTT